MSAPVQNSAAAQAGKTWIWPVVAVLVIVGALWASGVFKSDTKKERPQQPPVPVRSAVAKSETVPIALSGIGAVLPVSSVTVRTRVDGALDSLGFKEGEDVKAGQVLARIDPRSFQATLQQAEAQKARDEAQLANARADLARYGQLIKEDATSQQQLDTQKALVAQLAATVKTDDATINAARVQLSYTTITAPISGRVGARLVDAGNIVHAADANGLLVINQIDPIAVQFSLPESNFQQINAALRQRGAKALVVEAIDRGSREVLATGHLVLLNNQIDTTTGTIALKGHFPNAAHKLWPGQSVDARIVLGDQENAITIPTAAVQRSQDGNFAYVVDGQQVRMQPLDVTETIGEKTVVGKGLQAGDRVVTEGQYRLQPGAHVAEAATAAASAASGAAPGASK
ncbi:efflux RND transporter periplasmic adaptor subunit [Paucibacter sp. R3-3]|uniref:Efflux RND transporter periplasmic adaptor subunit n=1 Tax=Roseateles agri TaxID=3098619 RepID=A0ABU5DDK3_9BURK|nr:efflux RND transporter periplasmic adaptor subunit [Paucibacter sp. R3-3]MDY0744365.1 efflux RND transporter periplasmic adaptor subunit [Paucibacter sp. R3-3]